MRLKHLEIRGFGRLRGSFALDAGPGAVALVLERNETGKSTLSAAILAALYGLESDKRKSRDRLVERDAYRPWDGGTYGLTLYLEKDGDELAIDRDFEREAVRVLAGGQDVTDRFRQGSRVAVGEGLLNLSREQFTRSVFVAQGEVVWEGTSGLTEALQRIADTRTGDTTAAAAIAALELGLNAYEGVMLRGKGKVDTEVERCQRQLADASEQLAVLTRQRERMSAQIDGLARREGEAAGRELQRALLRHEKGRAERARVRARLAQDDERAQRVAGLQGELAAGSALLALATPAVNAAEAAWANLIGAMRAARTEEEESDQAAARRSEAGARRDGLRLRRRPLDSDRDALQSAFIRVSDAQRERQRFDALLRSAAAGLHSAGISLEQARGLAHSFEGLSEEDRLALAGRTREDIQRQKQQEEREVELDRLQHMRAEIRHGQHARKHFGIWMMLVGMLPVMLGLSMHARLPFSPLLVVAPGVAAILVGIGVYATGAGSRKREDAQAHEQMGRLREILTRLEGEQQQRSQTWAELAARLGCPESELEDHYKRLRSVVEPALHQIDGIQERLAEQDAQERDAMAGVAKAWTLFDDQPSAAVLAERIELVKEGLSAWREADSVASAADTARWRADQGRQRVAERIREARAALQACGVALSDHESLEEGMQRLRDRLQEAQRLGQLRDVSLPELQRTLLQPTEKAELQQRVAAIDGELTRLEDEQPAVRAALQTALAQAGASGPLPRRNEEIDADLDALAAAERAAQLVGEGERAEARAFLAKYEAEAPRLMAVLETTEAALRRAQQFRAAVSLARDTLARIAKETHRDWAAALNRQTQEMLAGLGSDVSELRFDEHLGMLLRQGQQPLTGAQAQQQLSAGALDSVYLAARLGVSRLLSGGLGALPLVLDDPFSNADDDRLVAGLRLLLHAIAPHQQVVLMACQETRYRWARAQLEQEGQQLVVLRVRPADDGESEADAQASEGGES